MKNTKEILLSTVLIAMLATPALAIDYWWGEWCVGSCGCQW